MNKEVKVTPLYFDYVMDADYPVVIQVGGRFSAKSYNEQIRLACNLASKKDYNLLVIEDLEKNMVSGFYAGLKDKIEQFEHDKAYNMTKAPPTIVNNINKNKALFVGYSSDQQKKAVKALDQITEIIVEEGEWLTYDDFVALLHQLRGGNPSDRKLSILMNPVNEYCFVNEMFIQTTPDRVFEYFPNERRPKVFEKNIVTEFELDGKTIVDNTRVLVILSTHHDNPYLTNTQRASIEVLKDTDPEKYKQLGEAKFIKAGGVFFKEFQRHIHVVPSRLLPSEWRRYFVMDYGLDMLAGYWIAVDSNGKAHAYKEIYRSDMIVSDAAALIKSMTQPSERIYQYFAPPDLWGRSQESGKSRIELFMEHGIVFSKAINNRENGWADMKEWLKPYEDETGCMTANLVIHDCCENLIRCISQIKSDERNPNDVATEPHELTHSVDSVRYFLAGRPIPYKPNPVQPSRINQFGTTRKNNDNGGFLSW